MSKGDAFQRALDDVQRQDRGPSDSEPPQVPRLGGGVVFGTALGSGGKGRFGLALDWMDEPTDRPGPTPPPPAASKCSGDTIDEIAAELGLGAPLTMGELTSRWRDFVWRNHPDRQPLDERERANERVAIANTLYDGARHDGARRELRRTR
jgi:hypothetical protein